MKRKNKQTHETVSNKDKTFVRPNTRRDSSRVSALSAAQKTVESKVGNNVGIWKNIMTGLSAAASTIMTCIRIAQALNDPKWYENYGLLSTYAINKYLPWPAAEEYANMVVNTGYAASTALPKLPRIIAYELFTSTPTDKGAISIVANELFTDMRSLNRSSTPYTANDVAKYIIYNIAYRVFINSCLRYLRAGHTASPDDPWLQDYIGQAMFGANNAVAQPGVITTGAAYNGFDPAASSSPTAFKDDYKLYAPQIKALLNEAVTFYNTNLALEADILKKIDVESQYLFADADNPTAVLSTFRHMIAIPNNDDDNGVIVPIFTAAGMPTSYAQCILKCHDYLEAAWGTGSIFGTIRADLAHTYGVDYGYKAPDISSCDKPFTAICDGLFNAMLSNINAPTAIAHFDSANNWTMVTVGHLANSLVPMSTTPFANLLSADFKSVITGVDGADMVSICNGTGAQYVSMLNSVWQDLINVYDSDCYTGGKLAEVTSLHGSIVTESDGLGGYNVWWNHGIQTVLRMDVIGAAAFSTNTIARGVSRLGTNFDNYQSLSMLSLFRKIFYWNSLLTYADNAPIMMQGFYGFDNSGNVSALSAPRYNVEALGLIPLETLDAVTLGASASLLKSTR